MAVNTEGGRGRERDCFCEDYCRLVWIAQRPPQVNSRYYTGAHILTEISFGIYIDIAYLHNLFEAYNCFYLKP